MDRSASLSATFVWSGSASEKPDGPGWAEGTPGVPKATIGSFNAEWAASHSASMARPRHPLRRLPPAVGYRGGVLTHLIEQAEIVLVLTALLGLAVAALSTRLRLLPLSEPLLAIVAGVLAGRGLLGLLDVPPLTEEGRALHEVASVLLAVSVMAVALRFPFSAARAEWRALLLLLAVVMPLMALTTGALVWAVLGTSVAAAAVLGAALCPTDPVLASSVVTGKPAEKALPVRTRLLLSWESGANDGLALPLVVAAIALLPALTPGAATEEILRGVVGGVLLGLVAGEAAARAINAGERHGATDETPIIVFTLVLAVGVLAVARQLEFGSVLAVFVTGLVLNARTPGDDRVRALTFDEALNRFAVLPLFVLLGAALPWADWRALGWPLVLLVVAVLLLRRLPWLLLVRRPLHLPRPDAVFLGWFGPIGVSAVFYLTEAGARGAGTEVLAVGAAVVAASTVVHGLSGTPGRRLYAARAPQSAGGD